MSGSCSLAATMRRAGLVFVLLISDSRDSSTSLGMTNCKSGDVSPHFESASAHFELFSQNPMQQHQQYEYGHHQHSRVESEHAKRDSEIAFFETEKHVRLTATPVIGLLHLSP